MDKENTMTGNTHDQTSDSSDAARNKWVEEVQEALDRTGDAIRTAWDATRESRKIALESAKQAASELSVVLDKGITAAKERWASADDIRDPETTPPEEQQTVTDRPVG
jgi:hypothetical protein